MNIIALPESLDCGSVPACGRSCVRAVSKTDLTLDGSALRSVDSAGKAFLVSLLKISERSGHSLVLRGFSPELKKELSSIPVPEIPAKENVASYNFFESVGGAVLYVFEDVKAVVYLLCESIYWSTLGHFDKGRLPFGGTAQQMLRLGTEATGIVFTLVFLIALTLALQSAIQLEMFGAGVYLAKGVGVLMFAEIGPLVAAIILAGRSGSAVTAEISSMVVSEEVKALRTMGIHPVQYLVLPRFQAMSVAVPLLAFGASIVGCFAGLLVAFFYSGVAPGIYMSELRSTLALPLLLKCLFKSLVFGWIIVLLACQKGLSVRGGADAVGRATTSCVVFSISGIILADALFSFIFY